MLSPLLPILAVLLSALAADDVRSVAEEVLSEGRYQTELPHRAEAPSSDRAPRPPALFEPPPAVRGASTVILWLLLAVVIAVLVIWLASAFMTRERGGATESQEVPDESSDEADSKRRPLLGPREAEVLASQGRYAEAVHLLLLQALARIQVERGSGLPDSLTSREVLRQVPRATPAYEALRHLVEAVEQVVFGGRSATASDYARCASSFQDLTSRPHAVEVRL